MSSRRGSYDGDRGGRSVIGRPHPLKNPWLAIPLVLIGTMVYTHHPDQGAALAKTVGNTYGTTAGIGVGTAPDMINGFSNGMSYMGAAPGQAAVPQAPAQAKVGP